MNYEYGARHTGHRTRNKTLSTFFWENLMKMVTGKNMMCVWMDGFVFYLFIYGSLLITLSAADYALNNKTVNE
jgi:hypothetical protein